MQSVKLVYHHLENKNDGFKKNWSEENELEKL